jgi:probable H4MPT-linked C1 transfer pathway protein
MKQIEPFTGTVGWDIGGANIKAARLGADGWQVVQQPCAIWQQRDELAAIIAGLALQFGPIPRAAITITAELSDAFRTKREGIAFVLDAMDAALPGTALHIFGLDGRFYPPAEARERHLLVAAANWLATALIVARHIPNCLLVDIGSTTTDLIPIAAGQVAAQGRTDPERLVRGELLYTGALRTPVCAIVSQVPLWGQWCPVAAELFATAQDVHLLAGDLSPIECVSPSADGRPVSPEFAAERLARVVCADSELVSRTEILAIARFIAAAQISRIAQAMAQVLSRHNVGGGPVVAVGGGAFLAQAAAARLGLACARPPALMGRAGPVAPAAAVALLLDTP